MILGAGTFAQATFSAVSVGLPALAPALRAHYRLSLGETGVVLGAVGIGMLLTLLAWGRLADRLSERVVIGIGLSAAGLALLTAGRTHSYGALVAALVVAGATGASVNAASGRAVMGWFPLRERGLASVAAGDGRATRHEHRAWERLPEDERLKRSRRNNDRLTRRFSGLGVGT